jgi:uncharacterized protein (TIGR02594 family)
MVRPLRHAARGKQPKARKAARSHARAGAAAMNATAAFLRRHRLRNLAVAGVATATMVLAVSAAVLRPELVSSGGPAWDASGNVVIRASDRASSSAATTQAGLDFDATAADAAIRPADSGKAAADATPPADTTGIVTYTNGEAVPTDPVRFAAPGGNAAPEPNVAGREARASVQPAARPDTLFNGSALIAEARKYIGTNPTRRATLWCGAFLDMVLRKTGHRGGGNLALGYARYGKRIPGPRVGAIVVLRRSGGGHVGIVTGVDSNGNPIVISGNHNHRVAVATYPRSRVIAYVVPQ